MSERTIAPAMKELIIEDGLGPHQAAKTLQEDSNGEATVAQCEGAWYKRHPSQEGKPKPTKKHTKPEIKIQLEAAETLWDARRRITNSIYCKAQTEARVR